MRITLVHNPDAGAGGPSKAMLLAALADGGHQVAYYRSSPRGIARAVRDPGDLLLVAGGDGTVSAAALAHARRSVPVGILAVGTANNIARAVGSDGPWRDTVAQLASAPRRRLDVGTARAAWGTHGFLASAGAGLLSDLFRDDEHEDESSGGEDAIAASRRRLVEVLDRTAPRWYTIDADGADRSGEYLLVEAMNLPAVGARLPLAPAAASDDGLLHVVAVPTAERLRLRAWLERLGTGDAGPPPVRTFAARSVRLLAHGAHAHVDDERWPASADVRSSRSGDDALRLEVVIGDEEPLLVVSPRPASPAEGAA